MTELVRHPPLPNIPDSFEGDELKWAQDLLDFVKRQAHATYDAKTDLSFQEVQAEWFGASPYASASINSTAIQAAIDSLPTTGGKVTLNLVGDYDCDQMIVMKSRVMLEGLGWYTNGIRGVHTGSAVLSFVDKGRCTLRDLYVKGDTDTDPQGKPKTGILMGRTASGNDNGNSLFENILIDGEFTEASLYIISAESNYFNGIRIWNTGSTEAKYCVYISDADDLSVSSGLADVSTTYNKFHGCKFVNYYNDPAASTIYVKGSADVDQNAFRDCYIASYDGAHITIWSPSGGSTTSPVILDGIRAESTAVISEVLYAIYFDTDASAPAVTDIVDITVRSCRMFVKSSGGYSIYAKDRTQVDRLYVDNFTTNAEMSFFRLYQSDIIFQQYNITCRELARDSRFEFNGTATLDLGATATGNLVHQNRDLKFDKFHIPYMLDRYNGDLSTSGIGEDDLRSKTIDANLLGTTGGLRILIAGTISGANGAKTIKLYFGASSWTIISAAAADQTDWRIEAEIFNTATNAQRVSWKGLESDGTETSGYETAAIDTTANVTLKITGECADANDVITMRMWIVEKM